MYLVEDYVVEMTVSDTLKIQDVMEFLTANKKKLRIGKETVMCSDYIQVSRFRRKQILGIRLSGGFPYSHRTLEVSSEGVIDEEGNVHYATEMDFSDLNRALLEKFEDYR